MNKRPLLKAHLCSEGSSGGGGIRRPPAGGCLRLSVIQYPLANSPGSAAAERSGASENDASEAAAAAAEDDYDDDVFAKAREPLPAAPPSSRWFVSRRRWRRQTGLGAQAKRHWISLASTRVSSLPILLKSLFRRCSPMGTVCELAAPLGDGVRARQSVSQPAGKLA